MIALLARLLGGSKLMAWLIVAGLVAGAVGGAYWYVERQGYNRAALEWTVRYTEREAELERQRFAELERQALANDRAKAAEAARIAQLRNEAAQLELQLQELADAAAIDPDADRIGLGAPSVQRLNGIGRP